MSLANYRAAPPCDPSLLSYLEGASPTRTAGAGPGPVEDRRIRAARRQRLAGELAPLVGPGVADQPGTAGRRPGAAALRRRLRPGVRPAADDDLVLAGGRRRRPAAG